MITEYMFLVFWFTRDSAAYFSHEEAVIVMAENGKVCRSLPPLD
jgi:hypothetical protein